MSCPFLSGGGGIELSPKGLDGSMADELRAGEGFDRPPPLEDDDDGYADCETGGTTNDILDLDPLLLGLALLAPPSEADGLGRFGGSPSI
jgi:hypothetical protein